MTATVTAGDDVRIIVTLTIGGVATDLSGASAISAAIVSKYGDAEVYVPETAQSSAAAGANWAGGVVVVEMPAAATVGLPHGPAMLEIQATVGGKKSTWPLREIRSQRGSIA